ncbi:hypothetical protein MATL_G00245430 [Megalops atlanticus]|uniref:Uncharacterized protein n=1 Tax=Megalops atlanticus TaxID=7932 RepID=A0A9D3SUB4_MEGAT|nr:hypothetical protein MATL_G00245430 [Megalops atlanticus]
MRLALSLVLFLLGCAYGLPVPFKTTGDSTRRNKLHVLKDAKNNITEASDSQLPWNITQINITLPVPTPLEPPLHWNATESNSSTPAPIPLEPDQSWNDMGNSSTYVPLEPDQSWNDTGSNGSFLLSGPHGARLLHDHQVLPQLLSSVSMIAPPPCPLPTCVLTQLGSKLQFGDEIAGTLTGDPHGIGKR